MAARMTRWLSRPALLVALLRHMRLASRLLREPSVPLLAKAVPGLAMLYLISPLDIVPDIVPLLGQLDDLAVALAALESFFRVCPAGPVAFHRAALASGHAYTPMPATADVIDAEWRRE
jgi:uncharacterized membrane protein YkvA (DUF1232 family)